MVNTKRIGPCLWFDDQAGDAGHSYRGMFRNSRIVATRYGKAGFETHHRPAGLVMMVALEFDGEACIDLMKKLDIAALRRAHDDATST